MIFRNVIIFCALFLNSGFILAESSIDLEWLEKNLNLGVIQETEGICKSEFRFVNEGKNPVEINDVKVSCGCTAVEFPHYKISKGDTAVIRVQYDPENRPGKFEKGIYVYLNQEKVPVRLTISGTVIASPETLELFYPEAIGDLHFDTLNVDFSEIPKGLKRREFVDIYNSGISPIAPKFAADTDLLRLDLYPTQIEPGDKATLTIYFDSSREIWTGERKYKVGLYEGEEKLGDISIRAHVIPKSGENSSTVE